MAKIEGYRDITPRIKNITFPIRGKMSVQLEDGRAIIVPIAAFPSIKKVPVKDRNKWYTIGNGFTWDNCPEVIHIEQEHSDNFRSVSFY